MKNLKMYEPSDKMITLIKDNYSVLQALGSFGISLGFGDKTVHETCQMNGVDTYTFLTVINFTINGYGDFENDTQISVPTLLHYLKASHAYYLDFQLPFIRRELQESTVPQDPLGQLIMRFFDEYAQEIDSTDKKLRELKLMMIKYLPSDTHSNNKMTATLYDIYNNEEWLRQHAEVEDHIFTPAIKRLERLTKQEDVSKNISSMVFKGGLDNSEALSDRERDVIIGVVQGLQNKEIADQLCISVNTVITHRRNIARKLQIHSPAGLTIYAIVNGLVDISSVKL